jgi:hypothetical protein
MGLARPEAPTATFSDASPIGEIATQGSRRLALPKQDGVALFKVLNSVHRKFVMKTIGLMTFLLFASMAPAQQQVTWNYEKLAAHASDSMDVTLDAAALRTAAKFLSNDKDGNVKKVVANLKGIYVRSFEYKKPTDYTKEDVDGARAQLHSPEWTRIVNDVSKEDGEVLEVYIKTEGDAVVGLVIIDADPKSVTLANIVGPIDMEGLAALGGHFNIPEIDMGEKQAEKKK